MSHKLNLRLNGVLPKAAVSMNALRFKQLQTVIINILYDELNPWQLH